MKAQARHPGTIAGTAPNRARSHHRNCSPSLRREQSETAAGLETSFHKIPPLRTALAACGQRVERSHLPSGDRSRPTPASETSASPALSGTRCSAGTKS